MRQRRVSLDVLDLSLLIIDQYPNNSLDERGRVARQCEVVLLFKVHLECHDYSVIRIRVPT
jgi:hypothetical protein